MGNWPDFGKCVGSPLLPNHAQSYRLDLCILLTLTTRHPLYRAHTDIHTLVFIEINDCAIFCCSPNHFNFYIQSYSINIETSMLLCLVQKVMQAPLSRRTVITFNNGLDIIIIDSQHIQWFTTSQVSELAHWVSALTQKQTNTSHFWPKTIHQVRRHRPKPRLSGS